MIVSAHLDKDLMEMEDVNLVLKTVMSAVKMIMMSVKYAKILMN